MDKNNNVNYTKEIIDYDGEIRNSLKNSRNLQVVGTNDGETSNPIINLDINQIQKNIKEKFESKFGDPNNLKNDPDGETQEPSASNEDQYEDKPIDLNFTPSYETEMRSSLPILYFELNYQSNIESIQFGIGLDEYIFQIIRKILQQIFPLLD